MRALLERAQREPDSLAAQEPALLAVFIEKVWRHTLAMTCAATHDAQQICRNWRHRNVCCTCRC